MTWDLGSATRDVVRVAKAGDFDGDGQQEVVLTSFLTQPAIVVASVSDFAVPVWTSEFVNNDIGGSAPDIAAIGVGDMDNDGNLEIVMTEGATEQLVVLEGAGADTYDQVLVPIPLAGKTVSVHGIDLADANGDGRQEAYIANLQGAVWVVSTDDVSTLTSADIYLIEDTGEQWLEASTGDLGGGSLSFVIAASNASTAESYQYTGGPGGDVTLPDSYSRTQLLDVDDFVNVVPGGLRVYGLDVAGDMDGDGKPEVLFTRGSTRGGADAPAIFVVELEQEFNVADGALPAQIIQIKNIKADVGLEVAFAETGGWDCALPELSESVQSRNQHCLHPGQAGYGESVHLQCPWATGHDAGQWMAGAPVLHGTLGRQGRQRIAGAERPVSLPA